MFFSRPGALGLPCCSGANRPHSAPQSSRPDGLATALAGADADAVLQREHEDLAVADLPGTGGAGGVNDGLDRAIDEGVVDGDLQFQLGQELYLDLGAAIHLGIAALPAATAHVA